MLKKLLLLFFTLYSFQAIAQESETDSIPQYHIFMRSPQPDKKRIRLINGIVAGGYAGSMTWLYTQWYKNYPTSKFHFFNDNNEWLFMDKYAHCWDAYSIAKPLYRIYRWGGLNNKKAVLYSAGIAYLYQTTVEVFDGFSAEWGFSTGDIVANTSGMALFAAQEYFWEEQRIMLKYSFHTTQFSQYRPDVLGSNLPERILKDYNGLTFWLTVNPADFAKDYSFFPKWLALAAGFGAEGMTGGEFNPEVVDGKPIPSFERRRQYYLSLDFYLSRIKTESKFLNSLFRVLTVIHLPAPAIEFSDKGKPRGHWLYF